MSGAPSTGSEAPGFAGPTGALRRAGDRDAQRPPNAYDRLAPPFQILLESQFAQPKDPEFGIYENDCTFEIPPIIVPEYQSMRFTLKGFTIPVSWYSMSSYENTLVCVHNGVTATVEIAPGNYSVNTFPAIFATAFLTAFPAATMTLALNSFTNKWTFTSNANFTFLSLSSGTTMFAFLGFRAFPVTDTTDYGSTSNVLQSEICVNFSGNNSVYIQLTNLSTGNVSSKYGTGLPSLPTLARAPVPVQSTGILNIDPNGFQTTEIADRSVTNLTVRLLDEQFNYLQATLPWQLNIDVDFAWNPSNSAFSRGDDGALTRKRKMDQMRGRARKQSRQGPPLTTDVLDVIGDFAEEEDGMEIEEEFAPADENAMGAPDDLAAARAQAITDAAMRSLETSKRMQQRARETYVARLKDDAARGRATADADALATERITNSIISMQQLDPFRNRAELGVPRNGENTTSFEATQVSGEGVQNQG
jgi:hypothetical protein